MELTVYLSGEIHTKWRDEIIKKCEISWCKIETDDYIGWIDTKNVWGI